MAYNDNKTNWSHKKIKCSGIKGPLRPDPVVKRRYAALRATLLCDASGTRIDAHMSRPFEPEKAVAFTSFSTNFTFFSIKDCDKFSPKHRK